MHSGDLGNPDGRSDDAQHQHADAAEEFEDAGHRQHSQDQDGPVGNNIDVFYDRLPWRFRQNSGTRPATSRLSTAWYASGDIRLANSAALRLRASAGWGGRDVSNRVAAWLELAPCVAQVGESLPAAPSDGRACRALGPPAPPNDPRTSAS